MFVGESHEIYEAMTDPDTTNGWRDTDHDQEIGDVCALPAIGANWVDNWDTGVAGGINVQKEWSIKQCNCVSIEQYGGQLTAPPSGGFHGGGGGGGDPNWGGAPCRGRHCPIVPQ
jgi:hypothetical protein